VDTRGIVACPSGSGPATLESKELNEEPIRLDKIMLKMIRFRPGDISILGMVLALMLVCANATRGQSQSVETSSDDKAEQILKRAVEAMGGSNYLNVRSVVSQGLFTQFKEGQSGLPAKFTDYIVYPDRERTEFRGEGFRVIQTNVGDRGWIYDGTAKTLKDMTPQQVEDFQFGIRTNIDNLLRGSWRKSGAKLSYVGRREAGLAKRNEVVRLVYPDGFAVEFEFGAKDGLPAKGVYKRKNKEGEEIAEEDRFAQHVNVNGVTAPFIIDHFRGGVQSSRINYESIEFNRSIDDAFFARPANAKAVK
jgi:hypothetical protein